MARSFTLEAEIARLGGHGDGIAETARGRVYVPYTAPGDRVGLRIGEKIGDGHAGELLELLAPGHHRVEPPCAHFHDCGGCALQHLREDFYAAWKRDLVVAALVRQGLGQVDVAPLVPVAPGDRRRADFVARRVGDKVLLGFHRHHSHRVVDIASCLVLDQRLVALMQPLRNLLQEFLTPGSDAAAKTTVTETGIDLLLQAGAKVDLALRERLAAFAERHDLARLALQDGERGAIDTIAVRRAPIVRFGGVAVELPTGGFLQASPAAEEKLVGAVLQAAQPARDVADLFAGCGTFALPLSSAAAVLAVEGDDALATALQLAGRRAGRRVQVEQRDLMRRPLTERELDQFDAVVFDPPRAGARQQAMHLANSKVPAVIGVSCAPGTFARDARLLVDGGYRLEHVVPVDQFMWTAHVELVGIFRR